MNRDDLFCRRCGALGSMCRCVEEPEDGDPFDPQYEGNYANGFGAGEDQREGSE